MFKFRTNLLPPSANTEGLVSLVETLTTVIKDTPLLFSGIVLVPERRLLDSFRVVSLDGAVTDVHSEGLRSTLEIAVEAAQLCLRPSLRPVKYKADGTVNQEVMAMQLVNGIEPVGDVWRDVPNAYARFVTVPIGLIDSYQVPQAYN